MSESAKHIVEEIKQLQNAEKAKWLENYVKHDIKSFGVGIPEIREIVKIFEKENQISSQQISLQIQFLDDLMGNEFTEPKLAAIIFIQLYWKTNKPTETLQLTSKWLENGWITDWNVCDWLCVRLLSPLVDKEPKQTILEFEKWNTSTNLWKARASLVPFAQCKTIEEHTSIILTFSEYLIKRDERFCKTAVGWVLRQYSKINEKLVIEFLERNKNWTTKEVIKNATKYL
jgi:3-methyladenine DNA glycosylase AlkD